MVANLSPPQLPSIVPVQRQTKWFKYTMILECILDFVGLCINGFVLKWRLTFGEKNHEHPHIWEERHIWLTNSYLNITFSALAIDLFFPIFYYVLHKRQKFKKITIFYMLVTFCLLGGSLCLILPIEEEIKEHPDLLYRRDLVAFYFILIFIIILKGIWCVHVLNFNT